MNTKEKKPIFKKWWFWVIIVLVLGGIAGGASQNGAKVVNNDSSTTQSSQETKNEEKTEFKVGETIAFDGKEVTVKSIERDWQTGNEFLTAKSGKEYVKVNVSIVNKSSSELSFNTFDWKIEDGNGSIEDISVTAFSGDDSLGSGQLTPGGKKEGSVVFEVTKDTSIKIHYQPSFWSSKKIVIVP